MSNNKSLLSRSDYLYMLSKIQRDKLKKKENELKVINEQKEFNVCTFKPNLISDAEKRNKVSDDVVKRNIKWDIQKKEKLMQKYKDSIKDQYKQCKFVPEIVSLIYI